MLAERKKSKGRSVSPKAVFDPTDVEPKAKAPPKKTIAKKPPAKKAAPPPKPPAGKVEVGLKATLQNVIKLLKQAVDDL